MLERLYIKDMREELPFRDRRTLKKWCFNNGVKIFSDIGCNQLFVLRAEFEATKMKQVINYINEKFGADKLQEVFDSTIIFFSKNRNGENAIKYKPKGEHEIKFLNRLQSF